MRPLTAILLLIFSYSSAICQIDRPDSRRVGKAFKKAYKQSKLDVGPLNWMACNVDSQYYKNDTIRLTSSRFSHLSGCCELVNWHFIRKRKCYITNAQNCNGTASSRIAANNDLYKISIIQGKAFTNIKLIGKNRVIVFTVLSIDEEAGRSQNDISLLLKRTYQSGL